jgi:hypothetical protein
MSPLEHFAAWQQFFMINAPLIFIVLFLGLISVPTTPKIQNDIPRIRAILAYSRKRIRPSSLEESFARGILHSKAY